MCKRLYVCSSVHMCVYGDSSGGIVTTIRAGQPRIYFSISGSGKRFGFPPKNQCWLWFLASILSKVEWGLWLRV